MKAELLELLTEYAAIFDMGIMPKEKFGRTPHPNDIKRWNNFVIACHRSGEPIAELTDDLMETLGNRGWPEGNSSEQAIRLERELGLLRQYDSSDTSR